MPRPKSSFANPLSLLFSIAATLHNMDFIKEKDIREGDYVKIYKAGEIIPELDRVLKEKRNGSEKPFEIPEVCPVCGSPVERPAGEVAYRCTNPNCGGIVREKLVHFASRDAMNIEGMGPSVVDSLLAYRLVSDPGDFYRLTQDELEQIERMGEKRAGQTSGISNGFSEPFRFSFSTRSNSGMISPAL